METTKMEGYDPEEVQELLDVVFKLSAKDINDKLIKVNNKPDIAKRRWFWELLQNAKDAVEPTAKVSVKLLIDSVNGQPFVEFSHNGNPFRYQDAKNLIFPYSDKDNEVNSDKSGRFGTGFLATHILSKKINVKGVYLKENQAYNFNFILDRGGTDKHQLADSINRTWQEFRKSGAEITHYVYNQANFETSFRYNLDSDALSIVQTSLTDIETSLPYVLAFIPKIDNVEIFNSIDLVKTVYRQKDIENLTYNINQYMIEKNVTDKDGLVISENIKIIICSDRTVSLAIEICEQDGNTFIKEFLEQQPILFCPFPIISTSNIKFPTAINCISFVPKEERDGIWLDNAGYGKANQSLFEKTIALYRCMANYCSVQKWKNTHLLFKTLNENVLITDLNTQWFKEKIQTPLKNFALIIPLVDVANGNRVPAKTIYFINETKEENRIQLWGFVKDIFPNNVPIKEEVNEWYDVIFEECKKQNISSFTKHLASYRTVQALQAALGKTKEDTLMWFDSFVSFICKTEPTLLNALESQILPNQFGRFKRKDELWFDDGTIDEPLKEILATIAKLSTKVYDWREDMLNKEIRLEFPHNRVRNISQIGTVITETVKEFLREDNSTNDQRDLFSTLLNWLTDNHEKAKEFFKGLKTDALLYKCADEKKIGKFTEMLKLDRDGKINVDEQVALLKDPRIHLLADPDLELKVELGAQILLEKQKEKEEFEFKKKTGDIFETLFYQIINEDDRFSIKKVEGEEDFIITNKNTGNKFYIEIKSVRIGEQQIQMTHKQAKKAYQYPNSYFLCIIPNNGNVIDEKYFKNHAKFDRTIGTKLSKKVEEALAFEMPETGISVEFEDTFLRSYNKYRYKFSIQHTLWGQDDIIEFISRLNNSMLDRTWNSPDFSYSI